jgi:hypothetical protein
METIALHVTMAIDQNRDLGLAFIALWHRSHYDELTTDLIHSVSLQHITSNVFPRIQMRMKCARAGTDYEIL